MRILALVGTLLLASCQGPQVPDQQSSESPSRSPRPAKPAQEVTGKWRVIALNGRPPDAAAPQMIVTITALEIDAQSQCVTWSWTYRRTGAALSTRPARLSEPVCERSPSQTEQMFEEIMTSATQIRHLTDGGLYLTNGTDTMVLQRSEK